MGLLSEEYPEIFAQLVPGQSKAKLITSGSGIKLEWVCEWGHKYVCSVYKRTARNIGCPYCSGNRVLPGFNDVATTNPEIAKKWIDSTVLPSDVTFGSGQKVLWDCGHGHIYRRKVREIVNGVSCRVCYDKKGLLTFHCCATQTYFQSLFLQLRKRRMNSMLSRLKSSAGAATRDTYTSLL